MSGEDVDLIAEYADLMQVGTRSMGNYALLERLGGCGRPVLLKRGNDRDARGVAAAPRK
jgi:3-deoxy-7-phosphoheptulonate synthase